MKKLILLPVICILGYICQAQEAFIEYEAQYTVKKIPTDYDFYMLGRYTRLNKNHPRWGYFIDISTDANVADYTSGLVYHIESFNMIGLEGSLGASLAQDIRSKDVGIGCVGKISFETKPNRDRAQWKIRSSTIISYDKFSGWWHQIYATISPFKWVSIGLQHQKNSVRFGGLIQINAPGVIRPFVAFDKKRTLIGLNISAQVR